MDDREREYKRHLRNALSNDGGVLEIIDRFKEEIPIDPSEPVPEEWDDEPLLLLGNYLRLLNLSHEEKEKERANLRKMLEDHGPKWVWESRLRLAAELEFVRTF